MEITDKIYDFMTGEWFWAAFMFWFGFALGVLLF